MELVFICFKLNGKKARKSYSRMLEKQVTAECLLEQEVKTTVYLFVTTTGTVAVLVLTGSEVRRDFPLLGAPLLALV